MTGNANPKFDTDAEWLAYVKTITDPEKLLRELIELDDDVSGIGDPYYRDLYEGIMDRAKEIVTEAAQDAARLLREVAGSGIEFDEPILDYLTVQIDRRTWDAILRATEGKQP